MWRTFDVSAMIESIAGGVDVVAGTAGLNRPVRRVSLASAPHDVRRVGAGEVLLTEASVLAATGEDPDILVGAILAAEAAAVVVRVDRGEGLADSLVAAFVPYSVPLITLVGDAPIAAVAAHILDSILDVQDQRLERVFDIQESFGPAVISGGDAGDVAAMLHTMLGCQIVVTDPDGRTTAAAPPDDLGESGIESATRQPIVAGGHTYGEIVAFVAESDLDDEGRFALERASLAIAIHHAHASATAANQERFKASSLEELIAGNAGDIIDVLERAESFGWDLSRPRAVLLASVDPPTEARTLPTALANIAAAARATLGRDAIIWTRSTTIAALLAPETSEPSERRQIAERLREELDRRVKTVLVSVGVGRVVKDPLALSRSYVEASRSVDVGRWAKGRHVTEVFDELGLERLLASTPADDLAEFVAHAIGGLIDHDRLQRTDLVETLGVWLETRNMAEAARRVHVHYNTLKNRLDRIESIVGPVLSDAGHALECEVAIHVFRHYDGPWTPDPD